ncbi:MAG: CvpA family protein [Lactococcus sp.]
MLLNLIIIIILAWSFAIGYSRGLILQVIYTVGTILAAFIAAGNYQSLATQLSQWVPFSSATASSSLLIFSDALLFKLDEAFYAGVAFIIIFVIAYTIIRLIGLFLKFAVAPLGKNGKLIAGLLGLCASYFGLQMFFVTMSLVPMATIQSQLSGSALVRLMVLHTPVTSAYFQNLFIESITHINPLG